MGDRAGCGASAAGSGAAARRRRRAQTAPGPAAAAAFAGAASASDVTVGDRLRARRRLLRGGGLRCSSAFIAAAVAVAGSGASVSSGSPHPTPSRVGAALPPCRSAPPGKRGRCGVAYRRARPPPAWPSGWTSGRGDDRQRLDEREQRLRARAGRHPAASFGLGGRRVVAVACRLRVFRRGKSGAMPSSRSAAVGAWIGGATRSGPSGTPASCDGETGRPRRRRRRCLWRWELAAARCACSGWRPSSQSP